MMRPGQRGLTNTYSDSMHAETCKMTPHDGDDTLPVRLGLVPVARTFTPDWIWL